MRGDQKSNIYIISHIYRVDKFQKEGGGSPISKKKVWERGVLPIRKSVGKRGLFLPRRNGEGWGENPLTVGHPCHIPFFNEPVVKT